MKKLICAKDIEIAKEQGQKIFYIDSNTIVTPLAEDAAKINDIEISTRETSYKVENSSKDDIDMDMVYNLFKILKDKGLLSEMLELLSNKPYEAETDSGGLKLIRGNTVRFKKLETKNPNAKVFYQELISNKDSSVNNGFLNIDNSTFDWEVTCEETYYIIEGDVMININGNTFTAYPGDVLYIPAGSKITLVSSDKAKLFYTTYLDK